MPDGYKCDRCDEFTEVGKFSMEMTDKGVTHRIAVHPPADGDETYTVNEYTLCDRCRKELVNWVENYE